jgi:hypothetical protein
LAVHHCPHPGQAPTGCRCIIEKTKLPATIYQLRIREPDDEDMDNQRWSHRTKAIDDLEVGTAVAIQNQTGSNLTKWYKTGIVIENKPNSKVMIRVDGSRRITMRNRRFVRPMEPLLRNATRSEPARRRTTQRPQIRQELPKENPPSRPSVRTEHVDEVPHEERENLMYVSRKFVTPMRSTTMLM